MIDRYTRLQKIKNKKIMVKEKVISSYPTHWHEFYEIELILSGEGKYTIDGKCYPIEKNMLFFMTPVNFHKVETDSSEVMTLMFMAEACDEDLLFKLSSVFNSNSVRLSDYDRELLGMMMHELNLASEEGDEEYSFYLLNSILGKIRRISNPHGKGYMSRVQKAMLYIRNNFRSDISLSDVAAAAATSPSYLSGLFFKESGVSFKEYLSGIRYDYAKKLLEYSDMSVTDVCFESGFCDYANFERRFKVRFGISPREYRRQINENGVLPPKFFQKTR